MNCGKPQGVPSNTNPRDVGSSFCSANHTRPSDWISCRPSGATPASVQKGSFRDSETQPCVVFAEATRG